jgi:DNA replication protein DnaC
MLITSNLPFSKWQVIFKDPMTTAAAIDRLVHHSVVLELNVSGYRAEQAKKRKQTGCDVSKTLPPIGGTPEGLMP